MWMRLTVGSLVILDFETYIPTPKKKKKKRKGRACPDQVALWQLLQSKTMDSSPREGRALSSQSQGQVRVDAYWIMGFRLKVYDRKGWDTKLRRNLL